MKDGAFYKTSTAVERQAREGRGISPARWTPSGASASLLALDSPDQRSGVRT